MHRLRAATFVRRYACRSDCNGTGFFPLCYDPVTPRRGVKTGSECVKGILLWLIGIPIPVIILLYIFVFR